jgi:hypothetical protein
MQLKLLLKEEGGGFSNTLCVYVHWNKPINVISNGGD